MVLADIGHLRQETHKFGLGNFEKWAYAIFGCVVSEEKPILYRWKFVIIHTLLTPSVSRNKR
jgi:hypothetical protein